MKFRHHLKNLLVMGGLVMIGLAMTTTPTHAATPAQLINMTPSSSSISIDPGAVGKGSFDVINEGTTNYTVTLSSAPYRVEGLNYDPKFTQLPGTVDPSKWIKFSEPLNQPLVAKKLLAGDYTINVPAGTQPGGYYAVIFAETSSIGAQTGVIPHSRVGDIIYITVNGTVNISGTVEATHVSFFNFGSSVPIGVNVGNDGGLHFMTTVDVTVKNILGNTILTSSETRYVLPGTQRAVTTTWSPKSPIGIYHILRSASLPDGVHQLRSRWIVVIQPWVIVAFIALVGIIIGGIIYLKKRFHRLR